MTTSTSTTNDNGRKDEKTFLLAPRPVLHSTISSISTPTEEEAEGDPRQNTPWLFERTNHVKTAYVDPSTKLSSVMAIHPACHHNETVNIYSHLIPALIFIYFFLSLLITPPPYMTSNDIIVCNIYAAGTTLCYVFSAAYHARSYVSRLHHYWHGHFDIMGIVSLMSTAAVPMIYYGLYGHTFQQTCYLAAVPLLATGCCIALIAPKTKTAAATGLRIAMFTGLAIPGVAAVIHGNYLSRAAGTAPMKTGWIVATALLNSTAAVVYALKVPERWSNKFDVYGSSHQIFHLVIVASSLVFWRGLMRTVETLRLQGGFA